MSLYTVTPRVSSMRRMERTQYVQKLHDQARYPTAYAASRYAPYG